MPILELSVDEVLSTTRAVRKRLDLTRPVERDLLEECLRLGLQAPTASNSQPWHFVVVTDPGTRAALAECYRTGWAAYADSTRTTSGPTSRRSRRRPATWPATCRTSRCT